MRHVAHSTSCPSCAAPLRYAPGKNATACGHCCTIACIPLSGPWAEGAARTPTELLNDLHTKESHQQLPTQRTARCKQCGIWLAFDDAVTAGTCPSCDASLSLGHQTADGPRPQAILPFRLTKAEARTNTLEWRRRRWLTPASKRGAASDLHQRLTGVYLPYWLFDIGIDLDLPSQGNGAVAQILRRHRGRQLPPLTRKDLLVPASSLLADYRAHQLLPWDLSALRPYDRGFLSGFTAIGTTEGPGVGFNRLEDQVIAHLGTHIRKHASKSEAARIRVSYTTVGYRLVLLPVWVSSYAFEGKTYRVAINGRTGAVSGQRPVSLLRLLLLVIAGVCMALTVAILARVG